MADWPDDTDDDVFEQLDDLDTLDGDGSDDPLDRGWSPVERPWAVDGPGLTPRESREGESLDARLARELPDDAAYEWDGIGDASDTDGEPLDDEVGGVRSGRLVASDTGEVSDTDEELFATDVGIDGGAASAEEAAVHLVRDPQRDE
jgi:Family of unknown function (DUF5709)